MTTVIFAEMVSTGKYDEVKMAKFHNKMIKEMEKLNAAIIANPKKYKGYSVCDPVKYADMQLGIYKHNFIIREQKILSVTYIKDELIKN